MGFRGPSPFHQNEYNSLDELTIFSQREVLDFGSCHKNHYKFKLKHGTFIGETKDHAISCQEACMLFLLVIDMRRKVDRKRAPAIHSPHGPSKTTCPPEQRHWYRICQASIFWVQWIRQATVEYRYLELERLVTNFQRNGIQPLRLGSRSSGKRGLKVNSTHT